MALAAWLRSLFIYYKPMNRIIIIGNGFDLAHGLKTSYKDFLEWVKSKIVENPDEYFERINMPSWDICLGTTTPEASAFFRRYYKGSKNLDDFISSYDKCKFTYKNKFLEHLIKTHNLENWVDIEEEYSKKLKICLQNYEKSQSIASITKLNQDFIQIKSDLEEYLCLEKGKSVTIKVNLTTSITKSFDLGDNVPEPAELDKTLFLNFNYTSYEKSYIHSYTHPYMQTIHIHGELKNEKNPIIFGYGNEDTEIYKEIKKINRNEFLTNMKWIKYLNANNYKELTTFIKSAPYQIYIWGHSCGDSDGTLLKELFENDNCVSIKPFYYVKDGNDNYSDIVMNISRHFSNNTIFRGKVMNKEFCEELK
jgi:hypothetical protein